MMACIRRWRWTTFYCGVSAVATACAAARTTGTWAARVKAANNAKT